MTDIKKGSKVRLLHVSQYDQEKDKWDPDITGVVESAVRDADLDDMIVEGTNVVVQIDDSPFPPVAVTVSNLELL